MYFQNYRLGKAWLDNCLKSLVSENPLTGNVVKEPNHCFDLKNSTFTIFFDHWEDN